MNGVPVNLLQSVVAVTVLSSVSVKSCYVCSGYHNSTIICTVYMYIYIYIYIYIYTHIHIYIHTYIYIHIYIYISFYQFYL